MSFWAEVASYLGDSQPATTNSIDASQIKQRVQSNKKRKKYVHVICFSKNRGFQLSQFLRSVLLYCKTGRFLEVSLRIHVIWSASNEAYECEYQHLIKNYRTSAINFIKETDGLFGKQLFDLINDICVNSEKRGMILFCVDDAVFYREVPLSKIVDVLELEGDIFTVHLKLSKSISFCQPKNTSMVIPKLTSVSSTEEYDILKFMLGEGNFDWNYPWDLSCSLYRCVDVLNLLQDLKQHHMSYANPNLLELNGSEILLSFPHKRPKACACIDFDGKGVASIITVNRVQTDFITPIYENNNEDLSVSALNRNDVMKKKQIDLEMYSLEPFESVHIGDFHLVDKVDTSILLPVLNGAQYLRQCVTNIFSSATDYTFELIIIDDGSTDDALTIAQELLLEHSNSIRLMQTSQSRRGVGAALNVGLKSCRSELITRIDVDDLCSPDRLTQQISFMNKNSHLFASGSSAFVIDSSTSCWESAGSKRVLNLKTSEVMVEWSMYFSCSLIHPSSIIRRTQLLELGGYSETHKAEDYDLWFRALENKLFLANIDGDPLIMLRKHVENTTNKTDKRSLSISTARDALAKRLNLDSLSDDSVRALQFGEHARDPLECLDVIEMLEDLCVDRYLESDILRCEELKHISDDANNRMKAIAANAFIRGFDEVILNRISKRLESRGINKNEFLENLLPFSD